MYHMIFIHSPKFYFIQSHSYQKYTRTNLPKFNMYLEKKIPSKSKIVRIQILVSARDRSNEINMIFLSKKII